MSHCDCCFPSCPVPIVEIEVKVATCDPFRGFRQNNTRDDGDGSDTYVVPIPQRCRTYRTFREHVTGSFSQEFINVGQNGDPDFTTRTVTISGDSELIVTHEQICRDCPENITATGSSSYVDQDTQFDKVEDSDGNETTYTSFQRTISYSYGGEGSTLPDHDPMADPPDPIGEYDDFIRTDETVDRDPVIEDGEWTGEFDVTTTTNYEFRSMPTDYSQNSNSQEQHTNQPDIHTYTRTSNSSSSSITTQGNATTTNEWSNPLNFDQLVESASDCADNQELTSVSSNQPVSIIQFQLLDIVELDDDGNILTEDHDNDPDTPEVSVITTHPDCLNQLIVRLGRFRFRIPDDFNPPPEPADQRWHGTYHRIQYRLIFMPRDDPSNTQIISEGNLEWEGPGEELETSDDWLSLTEEEQQARRDLWRTDWVDVDVPDDPGEVHVVLRRSQCYHGAQWVYHS